MVQIQEGQCGACTHFGETHAANQALEQMRTSKEAKETFVDDCGHLKLISLHLKLTAVSGCDGSIP